MAELIAYGPILPYSKNVHVFGIIKKIHPHLIDIPVSYMQGCDVLEAVYLNCWIHGPFMNSCLQISNNKSKSDRPENPGVKMKHFKLKTVKNSHIFTAKMWTSIMYCHATNISFGTEACLTLKLLNVTFYTHVFEI